MTGVPAVAETGEAVSDAEQPLVIQTSLDVPGFVWVQVSVVPGEGEQPQHGDQHYFNGGAGVLLDQIKGAEEPADFDEYWARQKARLAAVPMTVSKMEEVPCGDDSVLCYDIRFTYKGTDYYIVNWQDCFALTDKKREVMYQTFPDAIALIEQLEIDGRKLLDFMEEIEDVEAL